MGGLARKLLQQLTPSTSADDAIGECLILLDQARNSEVVERVSLPFVRHGTGVAVVASSPRHTKHPSWSNSLMVNAAATVLLHGQELAMRARLATPDEGIELWPRLIAVWPPLRTYLKRVHEHRIRLFILEPVQIT